MDKVKGLVIVLCAGLMLTFTSMVIAEELGPELVVNGDFSSGYTGWTTVGSGYNTVAGVVRFGTNFGAYQAVPVTAGKKYQLQFDGFTYSGLGYIQIAGSP